ncbi:HIT domain-containing protein [Pleionea sp. CnH1-48]|uniref:HIT domain-containing protein n=1 Tax=Pleionea sp. CnH1-48 TaxID=2954494 RepID=UPI00209839EB|nr:HIT domain-containing protein [Pleionea sp. CnH1-48]
MDDNCIFCGIIRGDFTSYELLLTPSYKVVLDIKPVTPGHILIIASEHREKLHQLSESTYQELSLAVRKISQMLPDLFPDVLACNVIVNDGRSSGQHIPHVHIHIIPRRRFDSLGFYWRVMTRFINPFSQMNRKKRLVDVYDKLIGKLQF